MTATQAPAKLARVVETLYPDWVKINTYESGVYAGSYEVFAENPTSVRFTRIGEPERSHRVRCSGGVPAGCSCKGFRFGGACKHKTVLAGMIQRGRFVLPTVDPMADVPEQWHNSEGPSDASDLRPPDGLVHPRAACLARRHRLPDHAPLHPVRAGRTRAPGLTPHTRRVDPCDDC